MWFDVRELVGSASKPIKEIDGPSPFEFYHIRENWEVGQGVRVRRSLAC